MWLLAISLVALLLVGVTEYAFGVLRTFEAASYSALAALALLLLQALWRWQISPILAQRAIVLAVMAHLCAGSSLGWIWPEVLPVSSYALSTAIPWLLCVQVFLFACFSRLIALVLSVGMLLAITVPPGLQIVLEGTQASLARELAPVSANLALGLVTLAVLMTWLAQQVSRLLRWGGEAEAGPSSAPQDLDELLARRTAALQSLLERAEEREAELTAMLDAFPGVITRVEEDGTYSYVNRAFASMLGRERKGILGVHVKEVIGPERYAQSVARRHRMEATGTVEHYETAFIDANGIERELFVTPFRVRLGAGRRSRFYHVGIDISEQKRAERALAAAMHDARQASHGKSRLVAHIAHELRTPLNGVMALSQLLRSSRSALSSEERTQLRTIERSARHLGHLIDDALEFERIEQGALKIRREAIAMDRIVDEVIRSLGPAAAARSMTVIHDVDSGRLGAWGDGVRARQILTNLLSNAIKYSPPETSVHVRTSLRNEYTCVEVRDAGPGLDETKLARLFTPYDRLGAEGGPVRGTGLGLSISAQLAGLMGGQLLATSKQGQGCCFTFSLPKAEGADDPELSQSGFANLEVAETGAVLSVLYVEDDEVNRLVFKACLSLRPHWALHMAERGDTGFQVACEIVPSVLVLDLNLPDVSGIDLAARLRAWAPLQRSGIALLTADSDPGVKARALEAGVDAVWRKPVDARNLLADIEALARAKVC